MDKAKQLSRYNKNLVAIRKHHPEVYRQLINPKDLQFKLFQTPTGWINGELLIAQQTHLLHIDPQKEIESALGHIAEKSHTVFCLIGAGLWYPLERIRQSRESIQRFILIEPLLEILQLALMTTDLCDLLADPRLIIIAGKTPLNAQTLRRGFQQLQFEDCYIYKHNPTWALSTMYQQYADQMYLLANELNMSGSTMIAMGHMFMANRFANLTMMSEAKSLTATQGLWRNRPAVLITAGPSLDSNIHHLKEHQDTIGIICADSAFPTLLKHGITPDFVTSLDPQNMVFEKLSGAFEETGQTNLICNLGVCPKIVKYFPFKHIFFSFNGSSVEKKLAALTDSKPERSPSDASPHLSLHAAITMEASPIIFLGHDLAYTDGKSHATHTAIPTDLNPLGTNKKDANPDILWLEDIYGKTTKTTRSFLNSKAHFEDIINQNQGVYVNATEGGIGIRGSNNMGFAEVLAQIKNKANGRTLKDVGIKALPAITTSKIITYLADKTKEMQHASKKTKELQQIFRKLHKALPETGIHSSSQLNRKQQNLLKQHDKLNTAIHKDSSLFEFVDEITVQGLRDVNRLQTSIQQLKTDYLKHLKATLNRSKLVTTTYAKALDIMLNHCHATLEFYKKLTRHEAWQQFKAHFEVDNIAKASSILSENRDPFIENHRNCHFYMGCLAAKQLNPKEMHRQFAQAIVKKPEQQQAIKQFKQQMQKEFLAEQLYAYPAVKEALTLRMLEFWGDIGVTAIEVANLINNSPPISIAHAMMTKEEIIMPCIAKGHHRFAQQQIEAGKHSEALKVLHIATSFAPSDDTIQMTLVQEYFDLGDFDRAVHHLGLAVEIDPKHGENWETIGDYLVAEEQFADARLAYEHCQKALPDNKDILLKIKQCYEMSGEPGAAQEIANITPQNISPKKP